MGKPASYGKKQALGQGTRLEPEVLVFTWGSDTQLLFDLRQVISILISISLLLCLFLCFLNLLSCKLLEKTMVSFSVLRHSAEGKGKGSLGLNSM